jgi:glutamate racemase
LIAIVDYGIGGLGLYKIIRKDFPKLPILYFSDSGEVPYGRLSKKRLRERLEKVFDYLRSQGAERIVVACHSASSVVSDSDEDVIGLRTQTLKATLKSKPKSVGIIGGGRTIRSGFYKRELNKAGVRTKQRVAQALSILIERGEVDGEEVERAIRKIIKPISDCEAVLLACTHYPVLIDEIKKQFDIKLIDPIEELYKSIQKFLNSKEKGESTFITTGNGNLMISAARKAFDVHIPSVTRVTF